MRQKAIFSFDIISKLSGCNYKHIFEILRENIEK